jgi:hypothetical protein
MIQELHGQIAGSYPGQQPGLSGKQFFLHLWRLCVDHCNTFLKYILIAAAAQVLLLQPAAAYQRSITCSSEANRYNYCRVDTENMVRLTRQFSSTNCLEGRTWGYDGGGVWVDHGCRAEFVVGYPGYNGGPGNPPFFDNGYNRPPEMMPPNAPPPPVVPRWAVGNFRGKNMRDHSDAAITITPDGTATAVWGGQTHQGYFDGQNLQLGNLSLAVERYGQGFITILRSDPGNRVEFRRVP